MGTFSTILIFVMIVVMAVSIIVLAIWVAKLSARLRMLSDTIFSGEQIAGAAANSPQLFQPSTPAPRTPQDAARMQGAANTGQTPIMGGHPSGQGIQSGQPMRSMQPSGPMQPVRTAQPQAQEFDDGSGFFDRYKQHENPNPTGGFGRQKPTIPFGEDRTIPHKRDSYAETAADSDFDPDSIDFSRVAGYRDIYNQ